MKIAADIRQAHTLPASFYRDATIFEKIKEQVFANSWLYVADAEVVKRHGDVYPFTLLPGVLDEPLLLAFDKENKVGCLSNVCTHRGKLIVEEAGNYTQLRCGYHGRCFQLDGAFKSMPEFRETQNFPSEEDHLAKIPLKKWLCMYFISLHPAFGFEAAVQPIMDKVDWMPLDTLQFDEEGSKDYYIKANWALYCDNYLEGFHVPFVHPALNKALDFKKYDYELYRFCNLQIGIAEEGEPHFDIPAGEQDFGKKVYAYYFWLFPNLMLNFYPWGLSLNVVQPLSHDRTMISFRSYRFSGVPFNRTVNNLENTEMEDEAIVESVQKGIQSRFYHHGRFSPTMEKGVHHFHRLIDEFLK